MAKQKYPTTLAVRALKNADIVFEPIVFKYKERGGTKHSSQILSIDEHLVIKTIVLLADKNPVIVLMHGDNEVSLKQLGRFCGTKKVTPSEPVFAEKLTGYKTGGISPFGIKTRVPVYIESSILELEEVFINGGKRGFFVKINPRDIVKVVELITVSVAV